MLTLNLTDPESSQIKFKVSKFPDGQQDITITTIVEGYSILKTLKSQQEKVRIKSRFNNFMDLELIVAATKALRRLDIVDIDLYIPYLLGARSDREFVRGGTSYLVDVVAPIINAQGYTRVIVMDVHSDVAAACIKNLKSETNYKLVDFAFSRIEDPSIPITNNFLLISPDSGALKKLYKVAEEIGYTGEILVCSKHRDTDGKLTKTHVPMQQEHLNKHLVIIDDICDGGRTFVNISKAIDEQWPSHDKNRYLIVTHGIFSAGFKDLTEHFDTIFCTNSVKQIGDVYIDVHGKQRNTDVKQLNVF